jgi:phage recombination protein Bet
MNTELQINPSAADNKMAQKLGTNFTAEQIAVLKANVAKGLTDTEFAYFLTLSQSVDLNPFLKQIWAYKDGRGSMLVFAGRDGFLANAQRHPDFGGIRSSEVYSADTFEADIPAGEIIHKVTALDRSKRGQLIGAYAIVYRNGKKDTIALVDFTTYNREIGAWKTHPAAMIAKVAETHALKKAYGLELQVEYDWDERNGIVLPRDTAKPKTEMDEWKQQLLDAFEYYQGEDKAELQVICADKFKAGEVTQSFVQNMLEQLHATPQEAGTQQELPL